MADPQLPDLEARPRCASSKGPIAAPLVLDRKIIRETFWLLLNIFTGNLKIRAHVPQIMGKSQENNRNNHWNNSGHCWVIYSENGFKY